MLISGQKNGPLAPSPIEAGVILCSEVPVAFDLAVISLMGLKYEFLPVLNRIPEIVKYPLFYEAFDETRIYSNEIELDGIMMKEMPIAPYGYFVPAEGWNVISKKY